MERVQDALDDDAAHRFAARLSGEDAQQLVVEMAHDMRSPLGSILILAERLRYGSGGTLTPIQERQLGLVYSAAFGLSALAGDVIELARGGTTLMDQPPMPFLVSDVLQSIMDILRPMAEEKRLVVRCVGPEADLRVGYQAALNRVLLNLATNAIKFTNVGTVDVLCKQLDRSRIEFSVKDTGRGIPTHVMSNLFEAFRQRQITGDYAFSSAGLGLSICKKLITAMGGELGVDTELEKGTRFHFVLDLPQGSRLSGIGPEAGATTHSGGTLVTIPDSRFPIPGVFHVPSSRLHRHARSRRVGRAGFPVHRAGLRCTGRASRRGPRCRAAGRGRDVLG
jgi:signal transduction histidine kinase